MKIIFNLTAMLILSVILSQVSFARENGNGNVRVKGHITKRGSYITPTQELDQITTKETTGVPKVT